MIDKPFFLFRFMLRSVSTLASLALFFDETY